MSPFTGTARIHVEAGRGGDGALSFRREAHTPRGGPDGGDGGRGGSVVMVADEGVTDLSRFRHAVHHRAAAGAAGAGRSKRGRAGEDLLIAVPPGTRVVRDEHVIADLRAAGDRVEVARGGEGGAGNRAFRSSTNRAPRRTVPGAPGDAAWLTLELRLPVDVAVVGLPNAGKSATLNALTGAGAPVERWPQSTREPAFGPLEDDAGHLHLVVDLPGLRADGAPRADGELEQIERAALLLHCVAVDDPEPAEQRIARVRAALSAAGDSGTPEVVVATGLRPEDRPSWAHAALAADGSGVEELRGLVLAELAGRT